MNSRTRTSWFCFGAFAIAMGISALMLTSSVNSAPSGPTLPDVQSTGSVVSQSDSETISQKGWEFTALPKIVTNPNPGTQIK